MERDLKWAILGTLAIVALIHAAANKEALAPAGRDPWEELFSELEAVLSAAAVAGG